MDLRDAVAVVTGASRGIGRATAIALAEQGAHVVCTARSTIEAPSKVPGTIDDTLREIEALGRRALAVRCDISKEEEVEALAQRTMAEFGRVDILVNNAAVNYFSTFSDIPIKRWDVVLNVNLRGTVLCIKAFLPQMLQQKSGSIINVGSGMVADPAIAVEWKNHAYYVSKVAMEALTQSLALELRPHNIAVNVLRVDLAVASEGAIFLNPEKDFSDWEKPEAGAEAILWMAKQAPSYTGQIIGITGVRELIAQEQGRRV